MYLVYGKPRRDTDWGRKYGTEPTELWAAPLQEPGHNGKPLKYLHLGNSERFPCCRQSKGPDLVTDGCRETERCWGRSTYLHCTAGAGSRLGRITWGGKILSCQLPCTLVKTLEWLGMLNTKTPKKEFCCYKKTSTEYLSTQAIRSKYVGNSHFILGQRSSLIWTNHITATWRINHHESPRVIKKNESLHWKQIEDSRKLPCFSEYCKTQAHG